VGQGQGASGPGGKVMAVAPKINVGDNYKEKYGFFDAENYVFKAKKGLSEEVVKEISWMKSEPEWMTKFRLRSLNVFMKKEMPSWGADLSRIHFDDIYYYLKSTKAR
jgi:Fe-S cluster assembly protein SufB